MEKLKNNLKKGLLHHNIIRYNTVDSTNKEAKRIIEKGTPEGTVIISEEQTGGRGRLLRSWFSPSGKGLWFSVIFMPNNLPAEKITPLTAVAATAVKETLKNNGINAILKWPNDIFINGRKAGGILAELKTEGGKVKNIILGIGLNINHSHGDFPPDLEKSATSIKIETGEEADREDLFHQLLTMIESFYYRFLKEGFASIRPIWLSDNMTVGKRVSVICSEKSVIIGEAIDLDSEGALIIREDNNNIRRITFGEIE